MRDFYILPRPRGTYEKLIKKLNKNNFAYIPYAEENLDLNSEEGIKKYADMLRAEQKSDSELDGSSLKFFVRVDDSKDGLDAGSSRGICDSRYFTDYIYELQNNPDCSYVSIYNDLIRNDGYIPRYFSALIKDCHNDPDRAKAEIFGSKVANALAVPTAYYFGIEDKSPARGQWTGEIENDTFAVATIDFVPEGFSIETFKDMSGSKKGYSHYHSLDTWLKYIDVCLEKRFPDGVDKESRKSLRDDFVRTYLFRVALLPDYDFAVYNGGALIEEGTNKFTMLPNFDMEGLMYEHLYQARGNYYKPNRRRLKKLINYCNENFSDVISDFMSRLEKAHKSGLFMDYLDDTFGKNNQVIYTNVHNACESMLKCYNNPQIGIADYLLR